MRKTGYTISLRRMPFILQSYNRPITQYILLYSVDIPTLPLRILKTSKTCNSYYNITHGAAIHAFMKVLPRLTNSFNILLLTLYLMNSKFMCETFAYTEKYKEALYPLFSKVLKCKHVAISVLKNTGYTSELFCKCMEDETIFKPAALALCNTYHSAGFYNDEYVYNYLMKCTDDSFFKVLANVNLTEPESWPKLFDKARADIRRTNLSKITAFKLLYNYYDQWDRSIRKYLISKINISSLIRTDSYIVEKLKNDGLLDVAAQVDIAKQLINNIRHYSYNFYNLFHLLDDTALKKAFSNIANVSNRYRCEMIDWISNYPNKREIISILIAKTDPKHIFRYVNLWDLQRKIGSMFIKGILNRCTTISYAVARKILFKKTKYGWLRRQKNRTLIECVLNKVHPKYRCRLMQHFTDIISVNEQIRLLSKADIGTLNKHYHKIMQLECYE